MVNFVSICNCFCNLKCSQFCDQKLHWSPYNYSKMLAAFYDVWCLNRLRISEKSFLVKHTFLGLGVCQISLEEHCHFVSFLCFVFLSSALEGRPWLCVQCFIELFCRCLGWPFFPSFGPIVVNIQLKVARPHMETCISQVNGKTCNSSSCQGVSFL